MENKLLLDIKNYLLQLKSIRDGQQTRLGEISDYSHVILKPVAIRNDHIYYGIYKPGDNKIRYLGNESKPEISLIRESHYLSKSIETIDGTMVRSKSEALIYNFLTEAGYTFVYELPLKGLNRTFYPDFTILSEIDYKTEIRIEHQGMYDRNDYRDRSEAREYDYWSNGLLPARDVYFTFDDNKGGFDIGPILEILKSRVRPQ